MKSLLPPTRRLFALAVILFPFYATGLNGQNLVASISGPNGICHFGCYDYQATATGGIVPYTYSWSNGVSSTSQKICFDVNGTYIFHVTVTDATGITAVSTITITVFDSPPIYFVSDNPAFCDNNTIYKNNWQVCPNTLVDYRLNNEAISLDVQIKTMTVTGASSYLIGPKKQTFQINWGEPGTGEINFIAVNSGGCGYGLWAPVQIVEEPVAAFQPDPAIPPGDDTVRICRGQTIWFDNTSENADHYTWNFGDGTVTDAENPQHTYAEPGVYSVSLIAYSLCRCADTTYTTVEVLDVVTALPDCIGTVCPGATVTYTSQADCDTYSWDISGNGTRLSGGGPADPSITVQWNSGPTGMLGLEAAGCGPNTCPYRSVLRIPIISGDAEIQGPEVVCQGDVATYSIEPYGGTGFKWSVSPGGFLIKGQGTNSVRVDWVSSPYAPLYWVAVAYDNCYLGCSGVDTIWVAARKPFSISGPVERCTGATGTFTTKLGLNNQGGVSCHWTLYGPNGNAVWTSGAAAVSVSVPFDAGAGYYQLTAVPTDPDVSCLEKTSLSVRVPEPPAMPTGIAGDTLICPGQPYSYKATGLPPGASIQWTIKRGSSAIPITQTGSPVVTDWFPNGPGWILARQRSTDGLGCLSDSVLLNVNPIGPFDIDGPTERCAESTASYTAPAFSAVKYLWETVPADAGVVVSGQGSNAVEIFWRQAGIHTLTASVCGQTAAFLVTVHPKPDPQPVYPSGLCPDTLALLHTSTPFAAYTWFDGNGATLGAQATLETGPGTYALQVVDKHGCTNTQEFAIDPYPAPDLSVSTTDPTGFCNNSRTVTLRATITTEADYTYDWFRDDQPLTASGPVYTTNQYGNYGVRATNAYGCTAYAGPVLVFEYCQGIIFSPGQPADCPYGSVLIDYMPTPRCDSFQFHLLAGPDYAPGSAVWHFGESGAAYLGSSTQEDPSFVFPSAGQYIVILYAYLQDGAFCKIVDSVRVHASANFSPLPACPGDTTHFQDISTVVPGSSIKTWTWDYSNFFGTIDTLGDAAFVYGAPGSYPVTLTVTAKAGCTASNTQIIDIPAPPTPAWTPPPPACAGNALPFDAAPGPDIAHIHWDFGDPASGAANVATESVAFHRFTDSGNFSPTLELTNNYGCRAALAQTVSIFPNTLAGSIFPPAPGPICAGKTLALSAPPVGISYLWSNDQKTPSITVGTEDIYTVTITDVYGCTYVPPPVSVQVNPAPEGVIKALVLGDENQILGVQYPVLHACYGDPVQLIVEGNGTSYSWSDGQNGTTITYSAERLNLLPTGVHTFTVTVTDALGCSAVTPPFTVVIDPVPEGFSIAASTTCATETATLNYTGPQPPDWVIRWNTGATALPLTTTIAGNYFVRVTNGFGCSARSNAVEVLPGPNISAVPSGCQVRCRPDTLCIPPMSDVTSWQWFQDGNLIPGATSPVLIAEETGRYWVEMIDNNGCTNQSDPLALELLDGYGNILGQVWSDVNGNGVIDAGDTLVNGIIVNLLQNGGVTGVAQSSAAGAFAFPNIPVADYEVAIDSGALPPYWQIVVGQTPATLAGCGAQVQTGLLLTLNCQNIQAVELHLLVCPGDSALYQGVSLPAGSHQSFQFNTTTGCDSLVNVTVTAATVSAGTLDVSVCPGETYDYNGTLVPAGTSKDFILQNYAGCDSTLTVIVGTLPATTGALSVSVCPGEAYDFNGTLIPAGTSKDFILQNYSGCDSILTVNVGTLPTTTGTLNVSVCPGDAYDYNGTPVPAGTSKDFILQNYLGCDSTLTVIVGTLSTTTGTLNVSVCPGDDYDYNGTLVPAGTSQDFILQNYAGCDSSLTVNVGTLPTTTGTLNVSVCPGDAYDYNGTPVSAGTSQDFILQNYSGCDSTLTVNVGTLPTTTGTLSVSVCPGEVYEFNGTFIPAGTSKDFILQNYLGCDSVLVVSVDTLPNPTGTLDVSVCPGEVYDFNGTLIPPGVSQQVVVPNPIGCDLILTVNVSESPVSTGTLNARICPGETFPFQGTTLEIGQTRQFTLQNAAGCDSILTVTVEGLPSSSEILNVTICPDETYTYNGVRLLPGEVRDFHFINAEGCDSAVIVTVSSFPEADFDLALQPSCNNSGTGSLTVLNPGGGLPPYHYSLDGTIFQEEQGFGSLSPGAYSVWLEDSNGCLFERDTAIPALEPLTVEMDAPMLPCDSGGVRLTPITGGEPNGLSYLWSTGARTPAIQVYDPGLVWVEVSNLCETLRREVIVGWEEQDSSFSVAYMPNVFAPLASNADNAVFRPQMASGITVHRYKLDIFDRWGNLVFRSQDVQEGWRGPFRRQDMRPAVFVWLLSVDFEYCGRIRHYEKQGDVTIVR